MMFLKVDNGAFGMETIFTSNDPIKMEEMKAKAQDLFQDREVIVTTN
jgi:hypothetical protein